MKKTIITLFAAVCCVAAVSAQNSDRANGTLTKKGYNILPAAGDFAIGIEASPILEYGIGLFSGANAPDFQGYNGNLYGKYFLEDNQAIRARVMLNVGSTLNRYKVRDDEAIFADPLNTEASTFDRQTVNTSGFGLYGGYEWRRGYGRLQAFYGAEAGFDFTVYKTKYDWGNPMTQENPAPSSNPAWANPSSTRTLNTKGGNRFGMQVGGFAGVEYFFARKMSIGGQLSLDLRYETVGQATTTTQTFNNTTNQVEEKTTRADNGGSRSWSFTTPVGGYLFLMFHF